MLSKNRLKFLRKPIHKIPCHELHCKIVLHTRSYNKKYCHKHNSMARMCRQHRKNVKVRQKDMQSPYGKFHDVKEKLCLKCGDKFGSINKFNRLCGPCNQDNEVVRERICDANNSSLSTHNYFRSMLDYDGNYL